LVGFETSSGWGIVQKGESFTLIQNPADRVVANPETAETAQVATTAKPAKKAKPSPKARKTAKAAESNLRVRKRYQTEDELLEGLFDW
jgi:hypothetical protein